MIGIVGGTGPEGLGLAVRWALAGEAVAIGSRSAGRAHEGADTVKAIVPEALITGDANELVCGQADVVVIAVPMAGVSAVAALAEAIGDKIVISVVAALEWIEGRPRPVSVEAGSAAQEIQRLLPRARVTSGFQTLSAEKLAHPEASLDEDTIICGDDADARHEVMSLARKIEGIRPVSGGKLVNSYYPELLVGMLANLNRIYKAHAGMRLVDLNVK
jgi:NADPH-dependent F420 reductase